MNEQLFIFQTISICSFLLIALRLGKESLITFITLQTIFANFFLLKQINLYSFNATASDAYTVGGMLGLTILQEYYGTNYARLAIKIGFLASAIFMIVSQLHLLYIPIAQDISQQAYHIILTATPRTVFASLFSYLVTQNTNTIIYDYFSRLTQQKYPVIRSYVSITISQLLDTILFSFFALYGVVHEIWDVIMISYIVKLTVLFLATPFLYITRYFYKTPDTHNT